MGYVLFIEFSNAYGLQQGTKVNFRGIQIGYIKNIHIEINSLIVLVHIHSPKILIPKYSVIEINQSGLFNDTFIDIIPTQKVDIHISSIDYDKESVDVFTNSCFESQFLCNYHYLQGDRGLNYDDLIRATTRISQRFDDPRFFCLFYLFLQNSINISDEILYSLYDISLVMNIFIKFVRTNFSSYLF